MRSCRPRASRALLAELNALERRREWLEAEIARLGAEMAQAK